MQKQITISDIKRALTLPDFDGSNAQQKMTPVPRGNRRPKTKSGKARQSGVLILLYKAQGELSLVLTRRRDDLSNHAGQVSFPGGKQEAGETFEETAVRETHEEIGVQPEHLSILGELTPLYIPPSDFEVHPTVAWFTNGKRPEFIPSDDEVAEILEVPLTYLLDPASRDQEIWEMGSYIMHVPFFKIRGHKVWGATAMMLSEFVERLRSVGDDSLTANGNRITGAAG